MRENASIELKQQARPLLVYILGWGRSGSSILANVLGSLPASASLGEVRYLWDRGLIENGTCGCEKPVSHCDFWQSLRCGSGTVGDITPDRALELARSIGSRARRGQFPGLHSARARQAYFDRNTADLDLLMGLYAAAFEKSKSHVLIDSSKSPFYALNLLYEKRSFDVAFLHLVRDPRAVLHSWKKTTPRKDVPNEAWFPRYSSPRSLVQWGVVNSSCERFAQLAPELYFQVRYEDFASNWHAALASAMGPLFNVVQGSKVPAPLVHAQHSISGHPSRFDVGQIELASDASWRDAISGTDRTMAALFCGRLARRYGYAMR